MSLETHTPEYLADGYWYLDISEQELRSNCVEVFVPQAKAGDLVIARDCILEVVPKK